MPQATTTAADEFMAVAGQFRGELLAHCYRMLGSVEEAEDVVQETYLRAWRGYGRFEGRSSVRTWLYRIATNACLTAAERRGRRPLPSGLGAPSGDPDAPLAPAPRGALAAAAARRAGGRRAAGRPGARPGRGGRCRAGIRLAMIAALQYLPARQRAVLILRDVLDWPAAQVASLLDTTTTAVNSSLRRARAHLARVLPRRGRGGRARRARPPRAAGPVRRRVRGRRRRRAGRAAPRGRGPGDAAAGHLVRRRGTW